MLVTNNFIYVICIDTIRYKVPMYLLPLYLLIGRSAQESKNKSSRSGSDMQQLKLSHYAGSHANNGVSRHNWVTCQFNSQTPTPGHAQWSRSWCLCSYCNLSLMSLWVIQILRNINDYPFWVLSHYIMETLYGFKLVTKFDQFSFNKTNVLKLHQQQCQQLKYPIGGVRKMNHSSQEGDKGGGGKLDPPQ